jgi:hypothetical protein
MPIEAANYIWQFDATNPLNLDMASNGANHIRMVKRAIVESFPNIKAIVTASDVHLNNPILRTTPTANTVPYFNSNTTATNATLGATGFALMAAANATAAISVLDLENRPVKGTGGMLTGALEINVASPSLWLHNPSVKKGRLVVDGSGNLIWQDQGGQNHFYVTAAGAVWTQQLGDLNSRIEDRANAWSASRRDEANSYSLSLYNSAVSVANDRVYRIQMAGYGEVGGTDGMTNVAPGVFTGARGTPYGAQVFAYRILQMHIPSQGGWVNIWVS